MKTLFVFCLCLFVFMSAASAQYLSGIVTRWSDSFVEWELFTEAEEEGSLKMRWQQQKDWSQWDYDLSENFGEIKLKWRDNPNEWELRGNNEIISARTIWSDNLREWRITNNTISLTLKAKWGNKLDEWELRDSRYGNFTIYTNWENDPRDWAIVDELSEEIPFSMKMMMVFIVVVQSSPKE